MPNKYLRRRPRRRPRHKIGRRVAGANITTTAGVIITLTNATNLTTTAA